MKIAVYCGSSAGNRPEFIQAAKDLGHFFAEQDIDLVYGGGKVGLMGTVADAVLEKGGKAYGVIPQHLKDREIGHPGLTELKIVPDMHTRKAAMAEMADAFVALPGGAGTLEEIAEVWTWAQLGHHSKACAFYDVNGFYAPMFEMINNMASFGFMQPEHAQMLIRIDSPASLLEAINSYIPPKKKWS